MKAKQAAMIGSAATTSLPHSASSTGLANKGRPSLGSPHYLSTPDLITTHTNGVPQPASSGSGAGMLELHPDISLRVVSDGYFPSDTEPRSLSMGPADAAPAAGIADLLAQPDVTLLAPGTQDMLSDAAPYIGTAFLKPLVDDMQPSTGERDVPVAPDASYVEPIKPRISIPVEKILSQNWWDFVPVTFGIFVRVKKV